MFAAPRESRRGLLAATYPLVFASPELTAFSFSVSEFFLFFLGSQFVWFSPWNEPDRRRFEFSQFSYSPR